MPITLGDFIFPENAAAAERLEEIGGRAARRIRIAGVLTGPDAAGIDAGIDALLAAAPEAEAKAPLSLRPGRRLLVRRVRFEHDRNPAQRAAAFTLTLEAPDPFEESQTLFEAVWPDPPAGVPLALAPQGTAPAYPRLAITALADITRPRVSDGARALVFDGILPAGSVLTLDGPERRVLRDGADVTPYTLGAFPRIGPGPAELHFEADPGDPAEAVITAAWRDRWH